MRTTILVALLTLVSLSSGATTLSKGQQIPNPGDRPAPRPAATCCIVTTHARHLPTGGVQATTHKTCVSDCNKPCLATTK